ncbi:MAG: hypothetical protein QOH72_288 [Solirubrobacteraceae bacterium]|nr:hypothetical protein [Solirubrobacteraceae bacterium]
MATAIRPPAPEAFGSPLPSPDARAARGRAARREVPRSTHAVWEPRADRRSPVDVLEGESADRLPDLVGVRYGRMLRSPFAFFRGTASIMAADLAGTPRSGIDAQLCGDAHLANFGGYGSPERALVFDINDFDETAAGPWEWDVKRLAASVALAARDLEMAPAARRRAVRRTVRSYRRAMRRFAGMGDLDAWYTRLDVATILATAERRMGAKRRRGLEQRLDGARARDSLRALRKLTSQEDGEPRFVSRPPLIVPVRELLPEAGREGVEDEMRRLLRAYAASLPPDRRRLVGGYRYVDMARKVVGVGSVGRRAWIVLLAGRDGADALVLQVKEARGSVLAPFVGGDPAANQGRRVVEGQQLMQAASDILLGWLRADGDGGARDYYVRQLWDWKVSADVERLAPAGLTDYGAMCGWTLARAHARSGDRIAIAAYLGGGDVFDRALAEFAEAYADRAERDYAALEDAARAGRIAAERDM